MRARSAEWRGEEGPRSRSLGAKRVVRTRFGEERKVENAARRSERDRTVGCAITGCGAA